MVFLFRPIGVVPEAPAPGDNGWQAHTSLTHFEVLLSMITTQVMLRRQEEALPELQQRVCGEQRWLRRRSLTRGARPLLMCSRMLAFLCCASPLRLIAIASVLKRDCLALTCDPTFSGVSEDATTSDGMGLGESPQIRTR